MTYYTQATEPRIAIKTRSLHNNEPSPSYLEMAPPLSIPLLLLTILVFSSTLFSSSEARNGIKISSLISQDLYNSIFLHKDDSACPAKDFYPYSAFIEATERFPRFGSCGSLATRKREIAAFLAQISHETTGGWATAPDGPYAWGLCFKEEVSPGSDYCDSSNQQWPCYPNKTYQGRGPIQLSWYLNSFETQIILVIFMLNYLLPVVCSYESRMQTSSELTSRKNLKQNRNFDFKVWSLDMV